MELENLLVEVQQENMFEVEADPGAEAEAGVGVEAGLAGITMWAPFSQMES